MIFNCPKAPKMRSRDISLLVSIVLASIQPNRSQMNDGFADEFTDGLHSDTDCPNSCKCVLTQAWCSGANLDAIPDRFNKNITYLDLQYNKISVIDNELSEYWQLFVLDFTHNRIRSIAKEALHNLDQLRSLSLSINQLESDVIGSHDLWRSQANLRMLQLDGNKIGPSLEGEPFSHLTNLVELDLSYNPILTIGPSIFNGPHSSLTVLKLAGTNLTTVPSEALQRLKNLQQLDMSKTNVAILEGNSFAGLESLIFLFLNHLDRLQRIDSRAFRSLSHLQELQVTGCRSLRSIEKNAFNDLESLRTLYLHGNGLQTLDDSVLAPSLKSQHYIGMFLYDNPCFCDCRLRWLHRAIWRRESGIILAERATCTLPALLSPEDRWR